MKTTTLFKIIQSELLKEGLNEFVDEDGNLIFFDSEYQFTSKILSYDEDIKKIVNRKIASIIIEMEHSPANYINKSKKQCKIKKSSV